MNTHIYMWDYSPLKRGCQDVKSLEKSSHIAYTTKKQKVIYKGLILFKFVSPLYMAQDILPRESSCQQ